MEKIKINTKTENKFWNCFWNLPDIFFIHFFNLTSCAAFETIDYTCQSQLFSHFPAPPLFLCGRFLHLSHWKLSGLPPTPPLMLAFPQGLQAVVIFSLQLLAALPTTMATAHVPRPVTSSLKSPTCLPDFSFQVPPGHFHMDVPQTTEMPFYWKDNSYPNAQT